VTYYRPKGSMCAACYWGENENPSGACRDLPFETFKVLYTDDEGWKVVRCLEFTAEDPFKDEEQSSVSNNTPSPTTDDKEQAK